MVGIEYCLGNNANKSLYIFSTYSCIWIFLVFGGTYGWGTHTYGVMTVLWSAWLLFNFNIVIIENLFCAFLCTAWYFEICVHYGILNWTNYICITSHIYWFLCWESWVACKQQSFISRSLEVGRSSIKALQFQCLVRPVYGFHLFAMFSHGRRDKWNPAALFCKGTNLIHKVYTLI